MIYLKSNLKEREIEQLNAYINKCGSEYYTYFLNGVNFGLNTDTYMYQQYDYINQFLYRHGRQSEVKVGGNSSLYCEKFWGDNSTEYEFRAWQYGEICSKYFQLEK